MVLPRSITLNGDKVTLEDNGTDKIYYTYDATGQLVSMNLNNVEYYYIQNAQGDITGLFGKAGAQVVSYSLLLGESYYLQMEPLHRL